MKSEEHQEMEYHLPDALQTTRAGIEVLTLFRARVQVVH
jgi:hypothetical protein